MNLATSGNQKYVQLASDFLELDLIQDNLALNGSNKNEQELTLDNNVKSDNLGPDCLDKFSLSENGNQNSEHESDTDWTTVRHKIKELDQAPTMLKKKTWMLLFPLIKNPKYRVQLQPQTMNKN